ncbi:Adenylate kinase [Candidatus Annandia adelgestsuga]|uniref:Adenylate kinase n=1 Tax=Candidatus Annandia adelgestsuga TaxID=1302411 RepID=A0A3S9J7T8_9ENTR|nr:nucleoside monophosphate kinase [Candidatus Annandia adelgestsuga]AZP36363.1 Adenylate kinase [Candidatus Annandia adelgestsuga]
MYIILVGAPGSGKGTQSKIISKKYKIPHISVGDLLRFNFYKNKKKYNSINNIMKKGKLIKNEKVISMVIKKILEKKYFKKFILDGIPRNIFQTIFFKNFFNSCIYFVFELITDNSIIIDRVKGRLIHPKSGRIYNTKYFPPINKNKDDFTGEPLIKRNDDKKEILIKRLINYHKNNILISSYYNKEYKHGKIIYNRICGNGNVYDINKRIELIINNYI